MEEFVITAAQEGKQSIAQTIINNGPLASAKPGVYNNGLLTICAEGDFDFDTLSEWSSLVGERALPIAFNAWGDVFCASYSQERFLLLMPQENGIVDLGQSLNSFYESMPKSPELRESFLQFDLFQKVRPVIGELPYGSCYILKPYQILGGDPDSVSSYMVGHVAVYLSLVAQTLSQINR